MPLPATLGVFDLDDLNPLTNWHEARGLDPDPKILIEDLCKLCGVIWEMATEYWYLPYIMVQKLELHWRNPDFSGNLSVDKEMLISYVIKVIKIYFLF